jgi:hypothetical protein
MSDYNSSGKTDQIRQSPLGNAFRPINQPAAKSFLGEGPAKKAKVQQSAEDIAAFLLSKSQAKTPEELKAEMQQAAQTYRGTLGFEDNLDAGVQLAMSQAEKSLKQQKANDAYFLRDKPAQ